MKTNQIKPGMKLEGKEIESWSVTSFTPRFYFGYVLYPIVIRFTDGSKVYGYEVEQ